MCEREPSGFPFTYSINFLEHFKWSKKCLSLSKKSKGDFFDRLRQARLRRACLFCTRGAERAEKFSLSMHRRGAAGIG